MAQQEMLTLENSPGLAAVLVAQYFDALRGEELVRWAQDALEAGHDSPSVLRLAIADSPLFTPDLVRLFEEALSDLGVERLSTEQVRIFHAQSIVRDLLASAQSPNVIAAQLARLLPAHDSPESLREWWQLDEAFWCEYCRLQVVPPGETLDQVVLRRARELLAMNWRAP